MRNYLYTIGSLFFKTHEPKYNHHPEQESLFMHDSYLEHPTKTKVNRQHYQCLTRKLTSIDRP